MMSPANSQGSMKKGSNCSAKMLKSATGSGKGLMLKMSTGGKNEIISISSIGSDADLTES